MEIPLTIGDALRRNATKYPLKIAARDCARQITYGELNDRVNRLANSLWDHGIQKNDPVALLVGNRIEHLEIVLALAKIGALAIPLDVKWRALEMASTLASFQPALLFMEPGCLKEFSAAKEQKKALHSIRTVALDDRSYAAMIENPRCQEPEVEVSESDPFMVLITSGTTGFPKGCVSSHRTYVLHCINNAIEKGLGVHDRALLSSPIYFNHGRSYTLGMLYFGATVFMHSHFDPKEVLSTIEREKITYLGAVPTMCERLLQVQKTASYDTGSLRCLAITGGIVHPNVLEDLKKYITPNIYRTYASTDCGQMAISKPYDMENKPMSAGRPIWCVELRIVDESGKNVPVGEIGEIICRSPLATQGYYKNPQATEASFRDGWFHTGDLGYFDEQGYLYISGRKKDMIKSGGVSVYPIEIESVLYSHPNVLEAAVIGVPDLDWGEAAKAVVVLKERTRGEEIELIAFCKERLAGYKVPKSIEVVSSLPHSEAGKVAKEELKAMLAGRGRQWDSRT